MKIVFKPYGLPMLWDEGEELIPKHRAVRIQCGEKPAITCSADVRNGELRLDELLSFFLDHSRDWKAVSFETLPRVDEFWKHMFPG